MTNRFRTGVMLSCLLTLSPFVHAQEPDTSGMSYFKAMFTIEGSEIAAGCKMTQASGRKPIQHWVPGCLVPLFHGNKGLYGSFQNLPPGTGVALGLAFKDSELNLGPWRINYQIDGQGAFNGSWTAGGFLTMRLAPMKEGNSTHPTAEAETDPSVPINPHKPRIRTPPIVVQGPLPKRLPDLAGNETKLLMNFYAFHTSLKQLAFFGLGEDTNPADRAFFGFQETITGMNLEHPLGYGFHIMAELNGRWPSVGSDLHQSSPSIEQTYTEATAPGLAQQPGFVQLGEGIQFVQKFGGLGPNSSFGADFNIDWAANFQQFFAPSASTYTFRRLTIDSTNTVNLMKKFTPNQGSPTSEHFATLTLRGWFSESIADAGHFVPFYFQPTIGGGDIDKQRTIPSYADYRFRAPNAMVYRAEYEQPFPKYSFIGGIFRAEAGKIANARGNMDFSHFRHSWGTGFTIRAGNFPYVVLMYSWGGSEGTHTFADLNLSAIAPGGGPASLW